MSDREHSYQATGDPQSRLVSRLAQYSMVAGAAGVALSAGDDAKAAPTPYPLPGGMPVVIDAASPIFEVDLDDDSVTDFTVDYRTDYGGSFGIKDLDFVGNGAYQRFDSDVESELTIRIEEGVAIDTDLSGGFFRESDRGFFHVTAGTFASYTAFQSNPGFVALRLSGGFFGYLQVVVNGAGDQLSILGGAVESVADTPITTVPEPGALARLAAGAAGLALARAARRRRRATG